MLAGERLRLKDIHRLLRDAWMPGLTSTLAWKPSKFSVNEVQRAVMADQSSEIEHIWQKTWRMGFYRGGPVFMSALAGIDIALWDLKGKSI